MNEQGLPGFDTQMHIKRVKSILDRLDRDIFPELGIQKYRRLDTGEYVEIPDAQAALVIHSVRTKSEIHQSNLEQQMKRSLPDFSILDGLGYSLKSKDGVTSEILNLFPEVLEESKYSGVMNGDIDINAADKMFRVRSTRDNPNRAYTIEQEHIYFLNEKQRVSLQSMVMI